MAATTVSVTPETLEKLGNSLSDPSVPLAKKYRNLFTLRNLQHKDIVPQIAKGLNVDSALFKHEVAFCLGQLKEPTAIPYLIEVLQRKDEHTMVRHEVYHLQCQSSHEGSRSSGRYRNQRL
jgi:deoxyhypusine monooxygenase